MVHVEGDGPQAPLFLIHGVGGAAWSWIPQRRGFGSDRRVYTWEARGHGDAARVADAGFADYLDDAREGLALAFAREGRPLDVAGHSMGGYLAIILAATTPHVARLALIDPVYSEDGTTHVAAPLRGLANAMVAPVVRSTARGGRLARTLGRAVFAASFTDRAAMRTYWEWQRAQQPLEFPQMFREGIDGVTRFEARSFAPQITAPTLLLNGRFPNLRTQLRTALGERFSDERLRGGHYLQLDCPGTVNERLRIFFGETPLT